MSVTYKFNKKIAAILGNVKCSVYERGNALLNYPKIVDWGISKAIISV